MAIRAHERFRVHIDRIGTSASPVIVVDDFLSDPEALVDAAAHSSFRVTAQFYPGIRASAPVDYANAVGELLRAAVREAFGWQEPLVVTECNFSLVTTPATQLIPFQRLPHFDGTNRDELAVLHYLCRPEHGGTSFYRHRRTGHEIIDGRTVRDYVKTVNAEVQERGVPPPRYVDGDTPLFERIARYEAAFNRALIYSGTSLHSGNVPPAFVPDRNPRTGRLTVNTFVRRGSPVPR